MDYVWIVFGHPIMHRPLTKEDYKKIQHPEGELSFHYMLRSTQAGAAAGVLFAPTLCYQEKSYRTIAHLRQFVIKYGGLGMLASMLIGPAIAHWTLTYQLPYREQRIEKCYELRNNRSNVRHDRYALVWTLLTQQIANHIRLGLLYGTVIGIGTCFYLSSLRNFQLSLFQKEKKESVFDKPKPVQVSPDREPIVLHRFFKTKRQLQQEKLERDRRRYNKET